MDAMLGGKLEKLLNDDDAMSKIREIANSMSKAESSPDDRPTLLSSQNAPPPPPKVGGYCAILSAIKPYLDRERCERADKLIQMMRIAEMAKAFIKL